jgi:hypothetical protein
MTDTQSPDLNAIEARTGALMAAYECIQKTYGMPDKPDALTEMYNYVLVLLAYAHRLETQVDQLATALEVAAGAES